MPTPGTHEPASVLLGTAAISDDVVTPANSLNVCLIFLYRDVRKSSSGFKTKWHIRITGTACNRAHVILVARHANIFTLFSCCRPGVFQYPVVGTYRRRVPDSKKIMV
jgi:hypothetical protein